MRHPRAAMAKPVFALTIGTVQAVSAGSASAGHAAAAQQRPARWREGRLDLSGSSFHGNAEPPCLLDQTQFQTENGFTLFLGLLYSGRAISIRPTPPAIKIAAAKAFR